VISVILIDDHQVVRQGVRDFLELQPDIAVVGEAPDGEQGVALAADLRPDVALIDLIMPGIDGVETTRRLKRVAPATRVVILTSFSDDSRVVAAVRAGATSYLLKDISPEELAQAVRAAQRDEAVIHPSVARRLAQEQAGSADASPGPDALTPRELEVLRLVARGYANRAIADALFISEKTTKTHISNILAKLQLADRTQAAIYALRKRLVPMEDA
jgi:two-component system, NarL family, response regulator LiaR